MKKNSPLQPLSFPLPLYDCVHVGSVKSRDGDHFSILLGMNREHAQKLKEFSLDENDSELQKNTSDRKRFGEGSFEEWYAKNRTPFVLIHVETNDLAGIVWFGPKPLGQKPLEHSTETASKKENWHTIAYRCYPRFRGKGLMKNFVGSALDIYVQNIPEVKLWAGINTENAASDALALGLGFKPHKEHSDLKNNFLVMIKE